MVSIWFEGIDDFARVAANLDASPIRVGASTAASVRRVAADIERTAKQLAPVNTGALRASIGVEYVGDGRSSVMGAVIRPTVDYGEFVEFGTSRMAPQPYLMPAFERHMPGFLTAVQALANPLP